MNHLIDAFFSPWHVIPHTETDYSSSVKGVLHANQGKRVRRKDNRRNVIVLRVSVLSAHHNLVRYREQRREFGRQRGNLWAQIPSF